MAYPIMLNLTGKSVVVVGGGPVAERRLQGLIGQSAAIKVIAPTITAAIRRRAEDGALTVVVKSYDPADIDGAFLVIAATDNREVNQAVTSDAVGRNLLVCCADAPETGNYITPATVERDRLVIAISTGGDSPTLATALKERLEEEFGPEWLNWPQLFGRLRESIQTLPTRQERVRVVRELLIDPTIVALVRSGELTAAEEAARRCI